MYSFITQLTQSEQKGVWHDLVTVEIIHDLKKDTIMKLILRRQKNLLHITGLSIIHGRMTLIFYHNFFFLQKKKQFSEFTNHIFNVLYQRLL